MARSFKLQHYKIGTVVKAISCANRNSKNVMLSGPVGSSKTTLCSQVADKIGLEFYPYSLCQQTTKSDLLGFLDASGTYRTSALREAFENGGLVLLDEMDSANPNVLSIINNMLSNEQYYFPDGLVKKNEDFKCICAMNSNGRGGDIIYTKSQRLDASTLDRFIFINIDIDPDLEKALTNNNDWYNRVIKFRTVIKEICKDDMVIGLRACLDGADLLEAGFSQSEVEDMVIYKGIDEDVVEAIKAKTDIDKKEKTVSVKGRRSKGKKQRGVDFKAEDGIITMEKPETDTTVFLDENWCKADDFKIAKLIAKELGL